MDHLRQAGSQQGLFGGSRAALAVENPGTGSGWQQNRQDWVLPAVRREWFRMESKSPCGVHGRKPSSFDELFAVQPLVNQSPLAKSSATGTRTRVARVRAEYPDQLDYSGRSGSNERVATNSALTRDMQLS